MSEAKGSVALAGCGLVGSSWAIVFVLMCCNYAMASPS